MADVEETLLPGVGVRYEFVTCDGEQIGVLVRHGGRRDLFAVQAGDPDASDTFAHLDVNDARTLADLLGVPHISEQLDAVQHEIEGLAIDWLRIKAHSPLAGRSLAQSAIHTRTGVSVVAVTRTGTATAAPGADFVLNTGDLIVAVGTPEGVAQLNELALGSH
jgi:TrkA domain protein